MSVPENNDYKVAYLSLADFGRKEIEIAEQEMPGLIACLVRQLCGFKALLPA